MAESLGAGRELSFSRQLSAQRSIDSSDGVSLELELLRNVYMKDLHLSKNHSGRVEMMFHVTPNTGENLHEKYTYLDLQLAMPEQYPEEPVLITVPASRGIADAHLVDILTALKEKASDLTGGPMIFELVEYAKDSLTNNNLPCGECVICLLPFHDGERVTRTDCYHYFHTSCLTRYTNFFEREEESDVTNTIPHDGALLGTDTSCKTKELECPVCREVIAPDAACLVAVQQLVASQQLMGGDCPDGNQVGTGSVAISKEIRHWQLQMAGLLERQREKGGLIDVHAKDEVIDENWVRPVAIETPHTSSAMPCAANVPPISTGESHHRNHDAGVRSNHGWHASSWQKASMSQRDSATEGSGGNRQIGWRGPGRGREKRGGSSRSEDNRTDPVGGSSGRGNGRGRERSGWSRPVIGDRDQQSRPVSKRREKGRRKGNGRGLAGKEKQDIGENMQTGRVERERREGWKGVAGGERLDGRQDELRRDGSIEGRGRGREECMEGRGKREDCREGEGRIYQQKRTCNNDDT